MIEKNLIRVSSSRSKPVEVIGIVKLSWISGILKIYKNQTTEDLTYDHWNLQMQNQDQLRQ